MWDWVWDKEFSTSASKFCCCCWFFFIILYLPHIQIITLYTAHVCVAGGVRLLQEVKGHRNWFLAMSPGKQRYSDTSFLNIV